MIIQLQKTGYVGKIIPRGEYHDGQTMVNHLTLSPDVWLIINCC
jgi:hypothetical protein